MTSRDVENKDHIQIFSPMKRFSKIPLGFSSSVLIRVTGARQLRNQGPGKVAFIKISDQIPAYPEIASFWRLGNCNGGISFAKNG